MRKSTKITAAVGGAAIALATGGVAYAYWTTSGSGSSTAGTGTDAGVSVVNTVPVTGMYPGDAAHALPFDLSNPGPGKQFVHSVVISVDSVMKGTAVANGCSAADFDITQPALVDLDLAKNVVVGGVTTYPYSSTSGAISMKNASTNQDGCKNVVVNLKYTAS
jgi:hypothetical protein